MRIHMITSQKIWNQEIKTKQVFIDFKNPKFMMKVLHLLQRFSLLDMQKKS